VQQQVLNITSVCLNSCLSYQACKSRASLLRRILLSSVAWLYLPHFSTLSHKRHDFRKIFIENKMSILIFSTTFLRKISNSKKNSARHYYKCTRVFMYSICNCQTLTVLEFCRQTFEKILKWYQISRKSVWWKPSRSMRAYGSAWRSQ